MAQTSFGSSDKSLPDERESPANFEQTLTRLEEIVHHLEDGKIGLDEALARYEEGVGLLRQAYELLQRAERRIELLSGVDAEGNPVFRPLEDVATFSAERPMAEPESPSAGKAGGGRRGRRSQSSDSP